MTDRTAENEQFGESVLPAPVDENIRQRVEDIVDDLVSREKITPALAEQLRPMLAQVVVFVLQETVSMSVTMKAHSGPLPDPATLAEYEKLHPGTASIFVESIKRDGEVRRRNSTSKVYSAIFGQIIILVIGVLGLTLGYILALHDKDVAGISSILTGLGMMVAAMVGRKTSRPPDEDD